jgi:hypothetical protein
VPGAAYQVDLNQQADYIVQAAALSLAAGVKRFGVYRLFDDHFVPGQSEPWGLVRPDGSRRPAYSAYQTVVKLFSDTREAHWIYSTRSSLVTLETGDRTVYVMWARKTDPVRFHVESSGAEEEATRVTVYGATNRVTGEVLPSVEGRWFVLDVAAALPDPRSDQVLIEGSPVILVVDGPPRAVWIEVQGTQWRLR